jgi:signal transduction histidine kinase
VGCSGTVTDAECEARDRAIAAYDVLDRPPRADLLAVAELAVACTGFPGASVDLGVGELRERVAAYGAVDSDAARFHPLATPRGVLVGSLNVHGEPVGGSGDVGGLLRILADRVVDALELDLATRRLAAADERLVKFAGQVSHDLKNPLAAVRMSVELVQEELGADGDPEALALLARAVRSADRMNRMIGDLRDFASIEPDTERVEVDLAWLVEGIVEDLGEGVAPGQVRALDLPTVRGDEHQLRALLQNLIENALNFSPWDAPVEMTAEPLPAGWRVSVADHGSGVPLAERERVFDPMVRLDASVPGTGLGLTTCRRIVDAHDGRIGIDDHPGGGSVVWFELPG